NLETSEISLHKYEEILNTELKQMNEDQRRYSVFNDIEILDALRCESSEGIVRVIENYFKKIRDVKITTIWSIYLAIRINLIYADFLTELGQNASNIVPKQTSIEEIAVKLDTKEKLQKYVVEVCLDALEFRNQTRKSCYFDVVEAAKKYIDENYANPEISLNEVSGHIHMSACHFSTIFSHETGTTFMRYLTNIRMKKAKELLQKTSLKSGEIGLLVGYKDPHYFSYFFKKNTGCKPSDYKEQLNG
ncbi:MAG: AraC family transcriptional regulator, partial [Bacillota bacterium]